MDRRIWFTSDLHLCHNREFIYSARGFNSVQEMNEAIISNWNKVVDVEDDVYVLGDLMLNDDAEGARLIKSLKGRLHIILGNHDSQNRQALYKTFANVVEVTYATTLHYKGYHFYLSHYPTMTGNLDDRSLKGMTCNLYAHTHQKTNFYEDRPYMYHVGVDSHDCKPVLLDDIIEEMKNKAIECLEML